MMTCIDQNVSRLAIAILVGGLSLSGAAQANQYDSHPVGYKAGKMMKHGGMMHIDERIRAMRDKLDLTPTQEPKWDKVAEVMRENERSVHKLIEARHKNESANAVAELKAHEKIAKARENALERLIPVFERFYNTLTSRQKEIADGMFAPGMGPRQGDARYSGKSHSMKKGDNDKVYRDDEGYVWIDNGTPRVTEE